MCLYSLVHPLSQDTSQNVRIFADNCALYQRAKNAVQCGVLERTLFYYTTTSWEVTHSNSDQTSKAFMQNFAANKYN